MSKFGGRARKRRHDDAHFPLQGRGKRAPKAPRHKGYRTYIDSFTSLDDLNVCDEQSVHKVLAALSRVDRFSVFDATRTQALAHSMDTIERSGWIQRTGGSYPWIEFVITEAGRSALEAG